MSVAADLTLALGGDINLARGAYQAGARPFAPLAQALQADVVLANLESPLTSQAKVTSGIDLRVSPAAVAILRPFTHLSTENNHALDGGERGQAQNLDILRAAHIVPLTRQVSWATVRGRKLAFIAYLDDGQAPPLAAVRRAAQQSDLVVVMAHWGAEYGAVIPRQRQQARQLVAAGADLVVGSGPHVLQEAEEVGDALVLYSLGNLLFDQPYPATWPGAVVRVTVQGQRLTACAVPTFSRAGRVRLAVGAERQTVQRRMALPLCDQNRGEHGA